MKLFGIDVGLLLKLRKAKSAMNKEIKAGFDWKTGAIKAVKNFLTVSGLTGLIAVAAHFQDVNNLGVLFTWLPENVRGLVQPTMNGIIISASFGLMNWAKNRKNEIVMMVEVEPQKPNDRRTGPTPVAGAVPVPISVKPADLGPPAPKEPLTVTTKDAGA